MYALGITALVTVVPAANVIFYSKEFVSGLLYIYIFKILGMFNFFILPVGLTLNFLIFLLKCLAILFLFYFADFIINFKL